MLVPILAIAAALSTMYAVARRLPPPDPFDPNGSFFADMGVMLAGGAAGGVVNVLTYLAGWWS